MYQTILVPVDGSKRAEAIFTYVEKLAKMNDARVIFLRVEEEPIMLGRDEIIETTTYQKDYKARVKRATDYIDDLTRPGSVMGPRTVPRRTLALLESGAMTEKDAAMIHIRLPQKIYGIDMEKEGSVGR